MPFSIQYYCLIVQTDQNSFFIYMALSLLAGSGSRQKFRIHADPDPQHWFKVLSYGNSLVFTMLTMCRESHCYVYSVTPLQGRHVTYFSPFWSLLRGKGGGVSDSLGEARAQGDKPSFSDFSHSVATTQRNGAGRGLWFVGFTCSQQYTTTPLNTPPTPPPLKKKIYVYCKQCKVQHYQAVWRSRDFLVGAGVKVRLPAPTLPYTVDKTEEILNDILFVRSSID